MSIVPTDDGTGKINLPRLTLFMLVTLVSSCFAALNFTRVPETVKRQGGNRLNDAAIIFTSKLVLASRLDILAAVRSSLLESETLTSVYANRLEEDPGNVALRSQYVLILLALDRQDHARSVLQPLAHGTHNVGWERSLSQSLAAKSLATAIEDAFALDSRPQAAPTRLSPSRASRDEKELAGIHGWMGTFALSALARRQGELARAQELTATLQEQARRVAINVGVLASAFALNFILGIVVLIAWLTSARHWDLHSVPPRLGAQSQGDAFDPLAGWSMLLAFQVVSGLIGGAIFMMLTRSGIASPHESVPAVVGVQLTLYAIMIGLIGVVIRGRWEAIGLHRQCLGQNLLCGLCLFWGAFIVIFGVAILMSLVTHQSQAQSNPVFHIIEEAGGKVDTAVLMLALVAILGPLFEEILFRGVIYTSMRRIMSVSVAIPLNGIVFGAVHGDVNSFIPLSVLGMLLAYGYERTRSLVTSTVTHCLWNGQTFAVFVSLFG